MEGWKRRTERERIRWTVGRPSKLRDKILGLAKRESKARDEEVEIRRRAVV